MVSTTGTLTQSVFHVSLRNRLAFLTTNLPRTVTMHWDGSIERLDEFVTDLFEGICDVPCQIRTYYARVIVIIHIQ